MGLPADAPQAEASSWMALLLLALDVDSRGMDMTVAFHLIVTAVACATKGCAVGRGRGPGRRGGVGDGGCRHLALTAAAVGIVVVSHGVVSDGACIADDAQRLLLAARASLFRATLLLLLLLLLCAAQGVRCMVQTPSWVSDDT